MRVVELSKFKVGQRVIGNEYNRYNITKKDTVWYVVGLKENGLIIISNKIYMDRSFAVSPAYFNLFMEEVE